MKLPKDHVVCIAAAEDRKAHATRTRGKSGHGEGSFDEYVFVGTCLALYQNLQDATGQNAMNEFLDAHPPQKEQEIGSRSPLLSSARSLGEACNTFETSIMIALEQSGGDRLYGQAPRGSLE